MNVLPENYKGTMEKELEISEKIEDTVLKIFGREVFYMDKIVFLINKVMVPFIIFVFYNRCDLVTVRNYFLF